MRKKVWISLPLITSTDPTGSSVIGFTKGGLKKELEVEAAAFITKWLMDKNVPFTIDFESSAIDRDLVLEALLRRLQRALGYKVSAGTDAAGEGVGVEKVEADVATAVVAEGDQKPAAAWENPFVEAAEKASEPDSVAVDEGGRAEE